MDEEIERLVVSVRADTRAFAGDVAAMRAELDGPFAAGLERAGRHWSAALSVPFNEVNSALRICAAWRCRCCPKLRRRQSGPGSIVWAAAVEAAGVPPGC